jgi:hypothetical protein
VSGGNLLAPDNTPRVRAQRPFSQELNALGALGQGDVPQPETETLKLRPTIDELPGKIARRLVL